MTYTSKTTSMSKPNEWTPHDVSEFTLAHCETDLADYVLIALRGQHRKRITTRIADKLPGGKSVWRLRRQYGMTYLENETYGHEGHYANGDGLSLLLGHFTDARPLDAHTIEDLNPAYFAGRRARNHIRMETRNTRETLVQAAVAINRLSAAREALRTAEVAMDALTAVDQPLSPDKYALQRALGWRQETSR